MAGEAVSGRYGAARHAVADEDGSRDHPDSGDRSLVDRLLAGGEGHAFDWGWGDPATGGLVSDREPLHDIPELWDERSGRDPDGPDGDADKPFPTPRLHGEYSLDDGPAAARTADDRDWSDRGQDDLGSDDWAASGVDVEDRRPGNDGNAFARPFDDPGPDRRDRAVEHSADDRRFDAVDGAGLGDPLGALATGRVHDGNGPLGDGSRDRDAPDPGPTHDVLMDGDHAGARAGVDPLDRSPLAPPLPNRDPFEGEPSGLDALGRDPGADRIPPDRELRDREQPHHALFDRPFDRDPLNRDPLDHDVPDRAWLDRDPRPRSGPPTGEPADRLPADGGPPERVRGGGDRFGGASPHDLDRSERDPQERGANEHDLLGTEPSERKLVDADPRLRRWADRDRPSGAPRAGRTATPAPFDAEFATPPDPLGAERAGEDRVEASDSADRDSDDRGSDGSDQFGDDLFGSGPDRRNRPEPAPDPRDADPFADPAFTESALTGRIRITDADRPLHEQPAGDPEQGSPAGPDPLDVTPDPTTAFTAVAPAASARRAVPDAPQFPLDEYAARRRAAEQAAASAEEAAASAAERASAAIAAAARAAEEAEAAAEAAAKAAAKANEAAEAEERAIAEAVARGDAPGRQDAPEPPTQAVPLIAPARAPGRRPPPRRPAGPPPRGARPDEPGRSAGPPPRAVHRNAPARDSVVRDSVVRDSVVRDSAVRGGTDGEATAVLTGLDALRDPVRPPRKPEPAPAEMTTVTPRRPAAESARETEDADDVDDAGRDDEPEERGLVGRLTSRPVVAAVGVGAVLVLAAIVAIFTTSEPEAAPPEATPAAVSAPVVQPEPTVHAIDRDSEKATAFLTALRDADIPTSSSGQAEVEAADAICAQLDQGADEAQLARSVPAVLPDVTRGQASDVVDYAQQFYC